MGARTRHRLGRPSRLLAAVVVGTLPLWLLPADAQPTDPTARTAMVAPGNAAQPPLHARSPAGSLTVAPERPMAGEAITFTSRVRGTRRPVVLQRKVGARWVRIASGQSRRHGRVTLVARLGNTSAVRLTAPSTTAGGRRLAAVVGPRKRVMVVPQRATLELEPTAFVGEEEDAVATFLPARRDRTVILQRLVGGSWQRIGTARTNSAGEAAFKLVGAAAGTYDFRATASSYKGARPVTTAPGEVRILPDEVTIADDVKLLTPAEAASLVPGTVEDGSTLRFAAGADQPELVVGNVISLLPSRLVPQGALVRVAELRTNANGVLIATTSPATLADVIENIPPSFDEFPVETLSTDVGELPDGVDLIGGDASAPRRPARSPARSPMRVVSSPQVRLSFTRSVQDGDLSYEVSGHVHVRPGLEVEYHAKVFEPDDWKLGLVADYDIGVAADVSTTLLEKKFELPMPSIRAIMVAFVGPVPVAFTSELGPELSVELKGKVGIETSFDIVSDRRFGVEKFRGERRFYTTGGETSRVVKPRPYASGTATLFGGFNGNLYAYGLAGPYFKTGYEVVGEVKAALGDPLAYCVFHRPVAEVGVETSEFLERIFDYRERFTYAWDFERNTASFCDGSSPPRITTSTAPRGLTGVGYYHALSVENGTAPYRWSATGLPPGLAIAGSAITGKPTTVGQYPTQLTVTDKHGRTATRSVTIEVVTPNAGSTALFGKLARLSTGSSWYVDKRGGKHAVPDGGTYECLVAQGVQKVDTVSDTLVDLPEYEPAQCVRAAPGDIVRTSDSDAYLVNANWSRSWIPDGGSYECLRLNGHRVVNDVPRYYIDDLARAANATLSCYDARGVRGKVVRGSDGKSWYVDERGYKHHIPDGGTYECIAAQTGGAHPYVVHKDWLTQQEKEAAECVRANPGNIIRTDDSDSYLIRPDWTRSWIPDGGTFECLRANGRNVVNSVPRYYVDDLTQGADVTMDCYDANAVKGRVVRASDGSSWYVDKRGGKHHIPDGGTFECVAAQTGGAYQHVVPAAWLTQTRYEDAQCVRAHPGDIIRHHDGDAYIVNGDWTRSHIPSANAYVCFRAEGRALVNGVPRYYIDDLSRVGDASFPGGNCIVRRPNAQAFYVNNEGVKEWIPDSPTWDCEVGRGIRVLNPGDAFINGISGDEWHYCLNKANLRGKILRHVDPNRPGPHVSHYIHGDDTRSWIPDEFTYNCRVRQGTPVVDTRWWEYVTAFPQPNGRWDRCFDINTFKNRYVAHPDGDRHFVDSAGVRHYVHPGTHACMDARFGAPATFRWREDIQAISEREWAICGNTLWRSQKMDRGQWLSSGNGYRLVMQYDGNLVIYNRSGNPIWAVGAHANARHLMLHEGNYGNCLARVNYDGQWSWGGIGCNRGADRLVMQDDGNLVLYAGGTAVWASNTVGR